MLKALRNKKGVTLVELLAVVVILGIIAAIAVPTIGGLIERQQEKADIATLQNVEAAAKTYHLSENSATGIYALADLDIDLGSNTFGTASGGEQITHVKVVGSTVTFHTEVAATSVIADLWVNTTNIDVSGSEYVVNE
ncbi:MAG: prepilin-type N-terminal cleavage/methylation domain-containing protein [Acholeplasmataceae bacterium]|nr:prepilin-type N-terminal cleavage/methylation domain-containing protein [Acholeplasmataceae bacterium]